MLNKTKMCDDVIYVHVTTISRVQRMDARLRHRVLCILFIFLFLFIFVIYDDEYIRSLWISCAVKLEELNIIFDLYDISPLGQDGQERPMGLKYKKVGTLLCVSNFDMDSVLWPVCIIYRHRSNNLFILSLSLFYQNICTSFSLLFYYWTQSKRIDYICDIIVRKCFIPFVR